LSALASSLTDACVVFKPMGEFSLEKLSVVDVVRRYLNWKNPPLPLPWV
jgi:hypothetical protein